MALQDKNPYLHSSINSVLHMSDPSRGSSVPFDTLAFTESLGLQTFRRNARNAWSKEEDTLLLKRVEQLYPENYARRTIASQDVDWDAVADIFDDSRRGKDCRKRWTSSLDPTLRRGKWSEEEDRKLVELYNRYGPLWQQVALEIEGRTEHQCLKRFLEVLDPAQRNRLAPWSEEEELELIRLVKKHGTKWKTVAALFEGRPPLTIRNRWRNLVNLVARGRASAIILEEMSLVAEGNFKSKITELAAQRQDEDGRKTKKQKRMHEGSSTVLLEIQNDISMSLEHLRSIVKREDLYGIEGEVRQKRSDELKRGMNTRDSLHTQLIANNVAERRSNIEWKYGVTPRSDALGRFPDSEDLQKLIESGGSIQSQQLAQNLVSLAAKYGMEITVHQHVHHHYPPPVEASRKVESGQNGHVPDLNHNSGHSGSNLPFKHDTTKSLPQFYTTEPESQITRYQHFNYLPPLTETPKLNSSASSPASSSKGSTHHYYHHHHHHHNREESEKDLTLEDESAAKESDLLKLLNETEGRNGTLDNDLKIIEESRSNSMTPLTQAVQIVAAAEANESFLDRNGGFEQKKHKINYQDDDVEEGLDFFQTMLNLNVAGRLEKPTSHNVSRTRDNQNKQRSSGLPVSQHHPLHYTTSSVTPQPEKALDEEDEDIINSYGLYYNVYQGETSTEQTQNWDSFMQYGAIPFNPS